jgi:hypothetical protein
MGDHVDSTVGRSAGSRSSSNSDADGAESGTPGSYGDAASGEKTSYSWIWISVLFLILALTPVVVWAVSKSEDQGDETTGKNEVVFRKLSTAQIVGRIVSK